MVARKVILLRHAEAQPKMGTPSDKERILSGRGWKQLEVMSSKLQGMLSGIELVLCSNARRTRQTLEGVKDILPANVEMFFEDSLYHCDAVQMVERLRDLDSKVNGVMIVGHNPGMEQFLLSVYAQSRIGPEPKSFPTAAAAVFEGNLKDWRSVGFSDLSLIELLKPKG